MPGRIPERISSPASTLDTHISCYYQFFPPYYPLTLFFMVFQMAQLAHNTFDSRGVAFSLKPFQNATFTKRKAFNYIYTMVAHCENYF